MNTSSTFLLLIISSVLNAQINHTYFQKSYYTSEDSARYFIETAIAGNGQFTVTDTLNSATYFQLSVNLQVGLNKIDFPINSIPIGKHFGIVQQSGISDTVYLTKLSPLSVGNEVKVDRFNRSVLVNDTAFLPFGAAVVGDNQYMSQEGYNMAVRWGDVYSDTTSNAILYDYFLSQCELQGIMALDRCTNTRHPSQFYGGGPSFIQTFNDWISNDIPALLPKTRQSSALLGNMGLDEPGNDGLGGYAQEAVKAFNLYNPYHPTMTSYNHAYIMTEEQTQYEDILQSYIYWQAEWVRGREISEIAKKVGDLSQKVDKPFWCMPMTELNYSYGSSPMTPEEQYLNTYIMLLQGATGIYYFTWPNYHRKTVGNMQDLSGELMLLAEPILRRPVNQQINYFGVDQFNQSTLFSLRTMKDGTPVIIFVNRSDYSVNLNCEFPWVSGNVTLTPLLNRGKSSIIDNQEFQETLEPMATRAYKLDGITIADSSFLHVVNLTEEPLDNPSLLVNLISNGGFETNSFWTFNNNNHISYDNSTSNSGSTSLKFDRPNVGTANLSVTSPTIQLKANHYYEFKFSSKQSVQTFPNNIPSSGATVYIRQVGGPTLEIFDIVQGTDKENFDWKEGDLVKFRTGDSAVQVEIEIVDIFNQGTYWIDDIQLLEHREARSMPTSKNLVPNSSYENDRLEDWPNRWGLLAYNGWANADTFVGDQTSPFRMDSTNSYHKTYSLRVEGGWQDHEVPYVVSKPSAMFDAGIPAKSGNTYTFSVYMKAASPNTPVDVEVKNIGSSTFNVGTSWSRYTITGTKSGGWPQNYTSITFAVDGLVWIDAVQLEQGSAATPYEDDNYEPEYPSFKPTAVINGTYSGVVNTAIPFSSIGSSDIDGQIVSYSWDFGDGSTSIQSNPTHSYGAPGTYNVTLNVTDNEGNVGSNTTVAVIDPPTDIEDESIGDFTLFPVPARNELYVHSPMKEIVTYEILDAKANIVFADQLYFGQNKLDLSRFARGIYLLKTNEGVLEKFVIE